MLGIFLIICMTALWFIVRKAHSLLKDEHIEPVEIDSNGRTYNVCYRAVILHAVSMVVVLLGYMGCIWPYLLIEGIDRSDYIGGIAVFGLVPLLSIAYACYLNIRNARGYIKISTDQVEYKGHKPFSVKVSDIRKITYWFPDSYHIHLKEKGKKPLNVNLNGFHKQNQIHSLMKQLRDYSAKVSGRDKSLAHKLSSWKLQMILGRCYLAFCKIMICLMLLYASYCCIDYDFFRKDYTALFNALGADPNQSENAWPHYVQAAVNYTEPEGNFQEIIKDSLTPSQLDLSDDQVNALKKWFNENASSWASLKEAVSIDYCNATYEHISLLDSTDREDFSSPSDTGYKQIRCLYRYANAGCLAGVLDLDRFDLFQMQLASAKHFTNGKEILDYLVGYGVLHSGIKLLSEQDSFQFEDLQKARTLLKGHFPLGLPSLSIEGEILMNCSYYNDIINRIKIPIQTPFNPMFLMCGSSTGAEAYARKRYINMLEQARKGIEVEPKEFSITYFPIMRNLLFGILEGSIAKIYKVSQRAGANLLAAYFILDLEEYQLTKGCYPVDVSQLRQVGLTSQLPKDPDTDGEIIYLNDGQRAILYAMGPNAEDDGGYKDDKGCDIIYWQRNLSEEIDQ